MFAIDGLSRTDSVFGSGCLPSLDQIRLFRQVYPLESGRAVFACSLRNQPSPGHFTVPPGSVRHCLRVEEPRRPLSPLSTKPDPYDHNLAYNLIAGRVLVSLNRNLGVGPPTVLL